MSDIRKYSVTLAGHRTSYSVEPPFQDALVRLAAERSLSLAALIAEIDDGRGSATNLSSALRLAVLNDLQEKLANRA